MQSTKSQNISGVRKSSVSCKERPYVNNNVGKIRQSQDSSSNALEMSKKYGSENHRNTLISLSNLQSKRNSNNANAKRSIASKIGHHHQKTEGSRMDESISANLGDDKASVMLPNPSKQSKTI